MLSLSRPVACLGGALLVVVPLGMSCAGPSGPSSFSNLDGTWSGTYVVAECPGRSNCGQLNQSGPPAGPQPVSLTLKQNGDRLRGYLRVDGWIGRAAEVEGAVDRLGRFTISGGESWSTVGGLCGENGAGGWQVLSWDARRDRDSVTGVFSFESTKNLSSCFYSNIRVDAVNLTLTRVPATTTPWQGTWRGSSTVTECAFAGWTFCQPSIGDVSLFDLTLTQAGNTVTGELGRPTRIDVSGLVGTDGKATLNGVTTSIISGGTSVTRATMTVALDEFQRLQGVLTITSETIWNPDLNLGTYSQTRTSRLTALRDYWD